MNPRIWTETLRVGDIFTLTPGGYTYVVLNVYGTDIEVGYYGGKTVSTPVETLRPGTNETCLFLGRCQVIPSVDYRIASTSETPQYSKTPPLGEHSQQILQYSQQKKPIVKEEPMGASAHLAMGRLLEKLLKKSSELDNEEVWANELRSRGYKVIPPEGHDLENRRKGVLDAIQVVQEMKTILVGE